MAAIVECLECGERYRRPQGVLYAGDDAEELPVYCCSYSCLTDYFGDGNDLVLISDLRKAKPV